MIKKIYISALLFAAFSGFVQAQTASKLDLQTFVRLRKGEATNENIHLLVKGDVTRIKQLVEEYGGKFKYASKNIASVEIPEKNAIAFSNEYAIEQIENTNIRGKTLMDTARIRNNIDSAQAGSSPLPYALKGVNVIVGIIDGGIYWQHKDFKNIDSSTRIRYIWDETVTNGHHPPIPYSYGDEWNWQDINTGACTHIEPASDDSHGTCVAGVAAGNGNSVRSDSLLAGKYTGVAPGSEIIAVRVDVNSGNFAANMADAIDYIFKKADALGKPCVINTSIGSYGGAHDGKDVTSQLIDNLLDERNGRSLVAAAGNAGNIPFHLGYTIPADSGYTFFKTINSGPVAEFDWWSDTANFKNAQFAIGCNDGTGNNLGRTSYFNVISDFNPSNNASVGFSRSLFDISQTALLGTVDLQVTLSEGRYHVEAHIVSQSITYLWRLQTRGTGSFDLWSEEGLTGTSSIVESLNSVPIQFQNYEHADTLKTLTALWQCSDKVITVGNYSSRAGYLDVDTNYIDLVHTFPFPQIVGHKYFTSSVGPTRDGRLKPDIMATGNTIICTATPGYINSLSGDPLQRVNIGLGGMHVANGGTSLASAIVTGIAALYLEKRPTANYAEIKRAIICTAVKDPFTGPVANYEYGNGKVNAFAALTQTTCITFGAMDTFCLNYNPQANVDSGGCIAAVYGCMDSTADNYNPLANVSDGSCTYTGIKNVFGSAVSVQVMPNPFTSQTSFRIDGLNFEKGEIKIFNQLGSIIDEIKLNSGRTDYLYQNEKLSKGVYYYLLSAAGKNVKAGKLVVQ